VLIPAVHSTVSTRKSGSVSTPGRTQQLSHFVDVIARRLDDV
jgi:hypothetical protein